MAVLSTIGRIKRLLKIVSIRYNAVKAIAGAMRGTSKEKSLVVRQVVTQLVYAMFISNNRISLW